MYNRRYNNILCMSLTAAIKGNYLSISATRKSAEAANKHPYRYFVMCATVTDRFVAGPEFDLQC